MEQTKKRRGRPRGSDETKKGAKHIRMNARTQWVIELWAMWTRTSDTQFIEAAVEHYADTLGKKHGVNWLSTFHPHPAVRWLRTYLIEEAPLPDDHEARRAFIARHIDFFYRRGEDGRAIVNVDNADVLWGPCTDKSQPWKQIDAYRHMEGRWSAGKAMAKALHDAQIDPPAWPPRGGK